jgi:regulatory protein
MKGISKEILEEVVNEESDEEFERALELANKKISSYKNDSKEKIYRKLGGYLQRKGYSYDCIRNVLNKILF